jgi:hypothetical protein
MITGQDRGGELSGDNLLPVCEQHSNIALVDLWARFKQVHQWLLEHERGDTIAHVDSLCPRLKIARPDWSPMRKSKENKEQRDRVRVSPPSLTVVDLDL